jgi:hypothetical protein
MAPEKKAGFREARYRDTDMVYGKLLLLPQASFAVEKVTISQTERKMDDSGCPITRQEHDQPDAQEENDLHQAEKEIDPWQQEQLPSGQHQDKDIGGNKQLTPEIDGRHLLPVDMANGMGEDKKGGSGV